MKKIVFFFTGILFTSLAYSQKEGKFLWSKSPFEGREFIENNGQFAEDEQLIGAAIKFYATNEGVKLYFTDKGLIYRYDKVEKKYDNEQLEELEEKLERKGIFDKHEFENKEKEITVTPNLLSVSWKSPSANVTIQAINKKTSYHTFPSSTNKTIKASAFEKLIYKEIYPNIDVEYFFPNDKKGLKYNIIIHPGADLNQIALVYHHHKSLKLNSNGDLIIQSSFGDFIDHKPQTFYKGNLIKSHFSIKDSEQYFIFQNPLNVNADITIDPWITSPGFNTNRAYDVDYDQYGNVFAYGSYAPLQLVKFNSSGVIQWTFNATTFTNKYGDFLVDYFSSNCYIFEASKGLSPGPKAQKLDAFGNVLATFNGDPNMLEFWRVQYNTCSKKIVIGGGGSGFSSNTAFLDTNLTTLTPFNLVNGVSGYSYFVDVALATIDNNGNVYMSVAENGGQSLTNQMVSFLASTLTPINWKLPTNKHHFIEIGSIKYVFPGIIGTIGGSPTNGFNGMAVNDNFLSTYDGYVLRKWDKTNGNFLIESIIGTDSFAYGGLDISDCDIIYAGVNSTIQTFDASLAPLATIPVSGTIYDLKLGDKKVVYACGNGFVSAISITELCNNDTLLGIIVPTNSSCASQQSASANISGGSNGVGYTYSWNDGQTTQTALNLVPGIYTVTVEDNFIKTCIPRTLINTFTVQITSSGASPTVTFTKTLPCFGTNNGIVVASASGGSTPYNYVWSNGATGATASALAANIYTLTITDANNCSITTTVSIGNTNGTSVLATTSTVPLCNGNTGSATVTITASTAPYTYSWSNGASSITTATFSQEQLTSNAYTLTVTDANNCSTTTTVQINQPALLSIATPTKTDASCNQDNGSISITASGGTGLYTYSWSNGTSTITNSTTQQLNNLIIGNYSLTVTDNNGCSTTTSTTIININSNVSATVTSTISSNNISEGESIVLSAGGGTSYTWTPNNSLSCATCPVTIANPTTTTTYTLIVKDNIGCADTTDITINVKKPCTGEEDVFIANVFSPNNDGKNDILLIQGNGLTNIYFAIYDRWGNLMFESRDQAQGWDGNVNGNTANAGTYVYYLKATCKKTLQEIILKGNVSVVK